MSYNGSGTFAINSTGQPVVAGTVISSTVFNSLTADLGTGLSTAITKDGQTTTTARILFAAGISSTLATDATSISTGSILTLGGLGVTKAAWIGGLMNVAGAATFQSTIGITGALTATTINASGLVAMAAAATVGTTLAVSGTATMAAINASGTVAMAGAATVGTTLGVTGTATMAAINASGNISLTRSGATSADITLESGSGNSGLFLKTGGDLRAYIVHDAAANKLAIVGSNTGMGVDIYAGAEAGPYLSISSAGAVTIPGTLGVTGTSTMAAINASGVVTITANTPTTLYKNSTGGAVGSELIAFRSDSNTLNAAKILVTNGGDYRASMALLVNKVQSDSEAGAGITIASSGAVSMSDGLSVTGTLGVTGNITGQSNVTSSDGNVGFIAGTFAARATTNGTNTLLLSNGTAPVGAASNMVQFYCTAGEARVMDAAGNATLLSPHDGDRNWIHHCVKGDGVEVLYRVEEFFDFLNAKYGAEFKTATGKEFAEKYQRVLAEVEVQKSTLDKNSSTDNPVYVEVSETVSQWVRQ